MPKPSNAAVRDTSRLPSRAFVLDNGGFTTKAGFAPDWPSSDVETLRRCHITQNSLVRTKDKRTYVASEQEKITQWSEAIFRRPIERGQLVNWEAEQAIWEHTFFDEKTASRDLLVKEPDDTTLVLTEAPNTVQALQRNADEIIMEEWGFGGYARVIGPSLNAYNDLKPLFGEVNCVGQSEAPPRAQECLLVIDSGYSHTTITPLYNGLPIHRAIRRIDIGGKHLTNLLKEVISIRHFDLHQDTKIVNDIKEDVCFVSKDLKHDMEKTWKGNANRKRRSGIKATAITTDDENKQDNAQSLHVDYILPDGFQIHRGFSRPHDPFARSKRKKQLQQQHKQQQKTDPSADAEDDDEDELSMTLSNERFTVPEILFRPSDIHSHQPGLAETTMQSLSVLPPALQAGLLANILVVGGNANLDGFVSRLRDEVRALAPAGYAVRVRRMDDPVTATWLGGARMMAAGNAGVVRTLAVSREEYAEFGSGWVGRKFAAAGRSG